MNKVIILISLISTNAFAAGGGTGTVKDLVFPAINFVVLFGFLGWKLRKPVKEMFDKNADDVASLFGLAEEKDKEAQIRLEEYSKKLNNLDSEKNKIIDEANANAAKFAKEHAVETDQLISSLESDVQGRIENEKNQMVKNLNATLLDEVINKVKDKVGSDKGLQDKATKKLVSQI